MNIELKRIYSGCLKYVAIELVNLSKVIATCPPSRAAQARRAGRSEAIRCEASLGMIR
jgi:hypothetical protein